MAADDGDALQELAETGQHLAETFADLAGTDALLRQKRSNLFTGNSLSLFIDLQYIPFFVSPFICIYLLVICSQHRWMWLRLNISR